ncbi:hypothetical protein D3C75_1241070 [compost metagenome]
MREIAPPTAIASATVGRAVGKTRQFYGCLDGAPNAAGGINIGEMESSPGLACGKGQMHWQYSMSSLALLFHRRRRD